MTSVEIRRIPEHIAYMSEYDIFDYNDFFDEETGDNSLADLEEIMRAENPGVEVPEMPNDYNYFTHEPGARIEKPMHVKYYDMVNKKGTDTDKYRFVTVPEVTAAVMRHEGPYEDVGQTYDLLYRWIEENGYEIAGPGRSSAIHGPWDRDDKKEYLMEIQIPVEKA